MTIYNTNMPKRLFVFSEANTSAVRNEELDGVQYTVVPIVALVEGVLQGATSPTPELALSQEFGKIPSSWDGRPLVMNHPEVDGKPVHAGNLDAWRGNKIGFIFNSKIEDSMLKVEAWIDNAKVESLGGDAVETLARINNGDNIEVSTGLFADTVQTHGIYNNRQYDGVWTNVVPDHLALLSSGTIGACSNEDGCGIHFNSAPKLTGDYRDIFIMSDCTEVVEGNLVVNCSSCKDNKDKALNLNADILKRLNKHEEFAENLLLNSIPEGMEFNNARIIMSDALDRALDGDFYYIRSISADYVTYEKWSSMKTFRRKYSISANNEVTFQGDEEEVLILTSVVPIPTSGDPKMTTNTEATQEVKTEETAPAPAPEVKTEAAAAPAPAPVVETPKIQTAQEYINAAPKEMQEVLNSGLRLHNERKTKMISEIIANESNAFTEEALKGMNMDVLENVHKLSQAGKADYSGAQPARTNSQGDDDLGYTPVPEIKDYFAKPAAA